MYLESQFAPPCHLLYHYMQLRGLKSKIILRPDRTRICTVCQCSTMGYQINVYVYKELNEHAIGWLHLVYLHKEGTKRIERKVWMGRKVWKVWYLCMFHQCSLAFVNSLLSTLWHTSMEICSRHLRGTSTALWVACQQGDTLKYHMFNANFVWSLHALVIAVLNYTHIRSFGISNKCCYIRVMEHITNEKC